MITGVTCGAFDYEIHKGHILFLEVCRLLCDCLCVAVVPDCIIVENKNREPFYTQKKRAKNLMETGLVDTVLTGRISTGYDLLVARPDLYILGSDQYSNPWTIQTCNLFMSLGIPIVSTFEARIESTTRLLTEHGYIQGSIDSCSTSRGKGM